MALKVGFVSLGCPKNLINTERMLYLLSQGGYEIVAEDIEADVIVINTCAFIESAKQEAIDNILDIAWLKENHTLKGIVVAGCLSQRYGEEVLERMPEVDCVIGTGSVEDICIAVEKAYKGERYMSFGNVDLAPLGGDRVITTPEYFAYIQIAEGCENRCAYCVIPDIRGKFRSRPLSDIVEEAENLASIGVKEVCLVAQDTTRYGEDLYGIYSLDSLIAAISEVEGIEWIRLLYCYPDRITDELIDVIKSNDKVVKYIEMPIQHISDSVLERMRRRGGAAAIKNAVTRLRKAGIMIRTTVIVGFPGETKEDFAELADYVSETKFERLGVFCYSREENTPAYDMPDQISEQTKRKRHDTLMNLQNRIHNTYNERFVGKTLRVICEGFDEVSEHYYGRSYADMPEIDGKIYFSSKRRLTEGAFLDVRITDILDYDLHGEAAGEAILR